MRKSFKFNPKSDLHCVDPLSAGIDLNTAYVNGSVPGNVSAVDMDYNDVEDPASLMGCPSDTFEAIRQSESVKNGIAAKKAAAEAKSEAATE